MSEVLHIESRRRFRAAWIAAGGTVDVPRIGEGALSRPLCAHPIRTIKRRKDLPAKLLSTYNAI